MTPGSFGSARSSSNLASAASPKPDGRREVGSGGGGGRFGLGYFQDALVQRYVDEIVSLPDRDIFDAMIWVMERCKLVVEGAAAAPVAALLHGLLKLLWDMLVKLVNGSSAPMVCRAWDSLAFQPLGLVRPWRRMLIPPTIGLRLTIWLRQLLSMLPCQRRS